jgi:hypothetical protein
VDGRVRNEWEMGRVGEREKEGRKTHDARKKGVFIRIPSCLSTEAAKRRWRRGRGGSRKA